MNKIQWALKQAVAADTRTGKTKQSDLAKKTC